jgi:Gpi18-like mannosyltransferase
MDTASTPPLDRVNSDGSRVAEIKRFLIGCIIAGAVIRLAVAWVSIGSRDAIYWIGFAQKAHEFGLLGAYRADSMLNHPLLMLLWARSALLIGGKAGFPFIMKLPAIVADLVCCVILAKIWLKRFGAHRARLAIAAIAFNPLAIMISAYHCNTDSLMAMLSLLTMYCIAERANFFLAGLALGAAINVKLIPLLLIPTAASFCRDRRDLKMLIVGLSLWVIPFLPLLAVFDAVKRNMIVYVPQHERWGAALFLYDLSLESGWKEFAIKAMDFYTNIGRGLIILGALWFPAMQFKKRPWNPYELGFLTYAIFLVLAPGFGVQYTIMLFPLLLAISIERAWVYSAAAGIFLLLVYWMTLMPNQYPLMSYFVPPVLPMPGPLFGLIAWWVLAEFAAKLIRRLRSGER